MRFHSLTVLLAGTLISAAALAAPVTGEYKKMTINADWAPAGNKAFDKKPVTGAARAAAKISVPAKRTVSE